MAFMISNPLTSICIPCYNAEKFIGDTLRSVLAQTYCDLEIIVCDDCSTDNTLQVVKSFVDPRITIYVNKHNLGCTGNYNKALSYAQGTYVKLLCDDDIIVPQCVEKQVAAFEQNKDKNIVMVTANRAIVSEDGRQLFKIIHFPHTGIMEGRKAMKKSIRSGTNIFGEPGLPLLKTEVVKKTEPLTIKYCNDLELWGKVLLHGNLFVINDILFNFKLVTTSETVRIGWEQWKFLKQLIESLATNPAYKLSTFDVVWGKFMVYIKCLMRNIVTIFISKRKKMIKEPKTTTEEYADYLTEKYSAYRDLYLFSLYYPKLLKQFTKNTEIIDLGCGLGSFLRFCKRKNRASKGYDTNAYMVAQCKKEFLNVEEADILNIPDDKLTSCFCDNVLEHLTEDETKIFFNNLKPKMQPKGRLVLVVPGKAGYKRDYTHKTFVDEEMVKAICNNLNITLLKSFYTPFRYKFISNFLYLNMSVFVIEF
jgi:glycosyltransferase involved in cell wall biosynthesis